MNSDFWKFRTYSPGSDVMLDFQNLIKLNAKVAKPILLICGINGGGGVMVEEVLSIITNHSSNLMGV